MKPDSETGMAKEDGQPAAAHRTTGALPMAGQSPSSRLPASPPASSRCFGSLAPSFVAAGLRLGRGLVPALLSLPPLAVALLLLPAPEAAAQSAGVRIVETDGSTEVSEAGGEDTYTVVLNTNPSASVEIAISSSNAAATVSPTTLTFTAGGNGLGTGSDGNWAVAQTVTVTGVDDLIDNFNFGEGRGNRSSAISHTATSSHSSYNNISIPDLNVTVVDNETSSIIIQESNGFTLVTEAAGDMNTDTYTVRLTSQPVLRNDLVEIIIEKDDLTVLNFDFRPKTLSFNTTNWNRPQKVTITGLDDSTDQTTPVQYITHRGRVTGDLQEGRGGSPRYSTTFDSVAVRVFDNDSVGVGIVEASYSTGALEVTEAPGQGNTNTYRVMLETEPSDTVRIAPQSSGTTAATVRPATLTFTTTNWNTPQSVIVTGVNDRQFNANGNKRSVTISHTVTSEDPDYNGATNNQLVVPEVSVDVIGVESAIILTHSHGSTRVTEAPGSRQTDHYTVVLNNAISTNVIITLDNVIPDPYNFTNVVELTSPGLTKPVGFNSVRNGRTQKVMTFTNTNWDTPQTVTVTGQDDQIDYLENKFNLTINHTVISSPPNHYDGVTADLDFTFVNDNADVAGFTLRESNGSTVVTEAAGLRQSDTYTIRANTRPIIDSLLVQITLSDEDKDRLLLASGIDTGDPELGIIFTDPGPEALCVITSTEECVIRVTAVDDDVEQVGGSSRMTLRHSVVIGDNTSKYYGLTIPDLIVTVVDDDRVGLITNETNSFTSVTEADGLARTDRYTLALAALPTADVEIAVVSSNPAAATVSPARLTFTPSNWNTAQAVTVTAVDDAIRQINDRTVAITNIATSTDTSYDALSSRIIVTVVDNDYGPGLTISQSDGSTAVTEASGAMKTDTYTVVLNAQPSSNVVIGAVSSKTSPSGATVSPASLTFTTTNWDTAQTVTVTGVNDGVVQGTSQAVLITHRFISGDPHYSGIHFPTLIVSVEDNETPKWRIVESDGNTLLTEGGMDTYTVELVSQDTQTRTLHPVSSNPAVVKVVPATLTFTQSDWSTPQTVTVTAVDDNLDQDSLRTVTIVHNITSNLQPYRMALDVLVIDNDTVGVTVTESFGPTVYQETLVREGGDTDTYAVVLDTRPSQRVTIVPASSNTGAATVSPATLTFSTSNWNSPQTVTVTAVDDASTGNRRVAIRHTATSNDGDYNGIDISSVNVRVLDNDGLVVTSTSSYGGRIGTFQCQGGTIFHYPGHRRLVCPHSGVLTLSQATLAENDGDVTSETYRVELSREPNTNVLVEITSSDMEVAMASPATLTFTPLDWNVPQMATITAVDDVIDNDNNRRSALITYTTKSTDESYSDITFDIGVTVRDDGDTANPSNPQLDFVSTAYAGGEAADRRMVNVALSVTPTYDENGADVEVIYTVTGTASFDEDFLIPSVVNMSEQETISQGLPADTLMGTVIMSASSGTISIPVTILDDSMEDSGETIVIRLLSDASPSYTVGPQDSTTVTILDDDSTPPPIIPPPSAPVVSITGGPNIVEGGDAVFTMTAAPAPATGETINVNVTISDSGAFARSGQIGNRMITIDDTGMAQFTVFTDDDSAREQDGTITATVQGGSGYSPHPSDALALVIVSDNEPALVFGNATSLMVHGGGKDSYTIVLDTRPTSGDVTVTITGHENTHLTADPTTLTFTTSNWNTPQTVTLTAAKNADDAQIILRHRARGTNYEGLIATVDVTVVAVNPVSIPTKALHLRFGRTLSQQVVDALKDRFATLPTEGLQVAVAGETITDATPLAEHEGVLSKALGFENVTPRQLVEGSSFRFTPEQEGVVAPRLAFWGEGAFSSFSGEEEDFSLDGDVTTLLVGADWGTERWRAGAALTRSWGNGSYGGDNDADGDASNTLTGLFPYGHYALSPRLGIWGTVGYGWGELSLEPDDGEDYTPSTTMTMAALGIDGVLLDGGGEGFSVNTTADVLTLKTSSEDVDGLDSSEGNLSRIRVGLEATRPLPLNQGASLLPSMEVGIRQDSGDAEFGFGMDLGAGILWRDPERGISGELKGRTLLLHTEEDFQEQSLALSFSWEPSPHNRGPSLSMGHTMGAAPSDGMDALLNSTTIEGLDIAPGNGQQFEAELAYGFSAYNDRLSFIPALGLALSPTSRNYSLLWSLAPYSQAQADPWEVSLEGERQEKNAPASPVDHSLKLRFSTLF